MQGAFKTRRRECPLPRAAFVFSSPLQRWALIRTAGDHRSVTVGVFEEVQGKCCRSIGCATPRLILSPPWWPSCKRQGRRLRHRPRRRGPGVVRPNRQDRQWRGPDTRRRRGGPAAHRLPALSHQDEGGPCWRRAARARSLKGGLQSASSTKSPPWAINSRSTASSFCASSTPRLCRKARS